ncbi:MAG: RNA ligase [Euryarchaeota archaeon]|nr:RNA ligase [Euryarchaeota archaeon]
MKIDWKRTNSLTNFFYDCPSCDLRSEIFLGDFIDKKLQKISAVKANKLDQAVRKGTVKFHEVHGFPALQFRKDVGKIESGTVIYFGKNIEVIRGFPKIRRTLMLSPTLKNHFETEVAVEEKMNGYNVRIASIDHEIIALTRGGYICPYTTKKAPEIMDLEEFFHDNPELVICGEMVGTNNPYVSHYYEEIGDLGFRIFDVREKITNQPLPIKKKRELLEKYHLPPVRLLGIYNVNEAADKVKNIVKNLGAGGREGVVMKDPKMEIPPLKYTSSEAHAKELAYAFTFPFDFARAFFFSRVIREGFQAFEMNESDEKLKKRAHRLGESILYPMLDTIKYVSEKNAAGEDMVIDVENYEDAEKFARHLHSLGVAATIISFKDGKAVIRRLYQSTTDRITNYLGGGLY